MTPERLDVIGLGETMLSLVALDGTLDTATRFHATHGGAESNALVELAAAGLRTAWVSRLGDDPAGRRVAAALRAAGVDIRWVAIDRERPTGLMLRDTAGGVRYWRGGSAASALEPRDLEPVPVAGARAVLVSGITAMLGPGPQATAIALLERARGMRVVDPNLRQGLWGSSNAAELIVPLIERSDIVLAGDHELTSLFGEPDVESSARRCAELGPREVAVKAGSRGAAVLDADGRWHTTGPVPVTEVDPVGAGDAFDAAYIAARLSGVGCTGALRSAAEAGARAAGRFGDVTDVTTPPTRASTG